jgi:hypothetical protein
LTAHRLFDQSDDHHQDTAAGAAGYTLADALSTILGVTSSIDVSASITLTQLRGFYTYRSKFLERCSLGWLRGYEMRDGRLTISW